MRASIGHIHCADNVTNTKELVVGNVACETMVIEDGFRVERRPSQLWMEESVAAAVRIQIYCE